MKTSTICTSENKKKTYSLVKSKQTEANENIMSISSVCGSFISVRSV